MLRNHAFLFLFPLTLGKLTNIETCFGFEIIRKSLIYPKMLAQINTNLRKKKSCISFISFTIIPFGIYLLQVKNWNIRTRFEKCSKLTMKSAVSPVCSGGYIGTHFTPCSSVSIVDFGQYCYRNVNITKDYS